MKAIVSVLHISEAQSPWSASHPQRVAARLPTVTRRHGPRPTRTLPSAGHRFHDTVRHLYVLPLTLRLVRLLGSSIVCPGGGPAWYADP